jgi:hypothetical protein
MRRRWATLLAVLLIGVAAGGICGYLVAGASRSNVSVVTGTFYVGDRVATGQVDGWSYGMSYSVGWLDSSNSWHADGWPDCLAPVGSRHTVRFGWTPVDGPTEEAWRQVVWVSCPP